MMHINYSTNYALIRIDFNHLACLEDFRCDARSHNTWQAKFAAYNSCVTCDAALVGNDGRRTADCGG